MKIVYKDKITREGIARKRATKLFFFPLRYRKSSSSVLASSAENLLLNLLKLGPSHMNWKCNVVLMGHKLTGWTFESSLSDITSKYFYIFERLRIREMTLHLGC